MKKLALVATVSQLAIIACSGAEAADIRLKAPPRVAAAAYSWTGCYAGAHLGWGWAHHEVTAANFSFGPGGTPIAATNSLETNHGVYGGQFGCNYQLSGDWVVGIQGDVAGTDLHGNVADPFDRIPSGNAISGRLGAKTDWFASITARLGITAWSNQALFYVKGGAAFDRSRWDFSRSSYCASYNGCLNTGPEDRRIGWTAGAGAEWVISPTWSNWTAFAEYDYYDFGSDGGSFPVGLTNIDRRNALLLGNQHIQTVKIGLNYKLFAP